MKEKDWLSKEKLVQIIEKSISPEATVEHNIRLTDLTSKNNKKRQCDVVIRSGKNERETITIVEVQSRTTKFNITTFQGLIQKMRDVGAQHLICVSTTGFSSTIVEKAKELGGTVRLVMLNKYEPEEIPLNLNLPKLNLERFITSYESEGPPEIKFNSNSKIGFHLDEMNFKVSGREEIFNYHELNNFYLTHILKPNSGGIYTIKFPLGNIKLFISHNQDNYDVTYYSWNVNVTLEKFVIPVYAYSYEQLESGALAWVLESISTIKDITRVVRMPIVKNEDGEYISKFISVK